MKPTLYLFVAAVLPFSVFAQSKQAATSIKPKTASISKTPPRQHVTAKPVSQAMPVARHIDFTTFLNENTLLINGGLTPSRDYNLWVTDKAGNMIYTTGFTAGTGAHSFDMGKPLGNGEYSITVQEKDNRLASGTITLIKN